MTYPAPLRPASGDQYAPQHTQHLAAASWPDVLQVASETLDADIALVEQVRRREEVKQ
ncbi:hypothetical protein AB9K34_15590 [Sedimentitalea sp. XS_ASV28]|uniref:hypothetical protein n=1 Tax=Sedimentitalea sp. XS_ASV28 TaxID=3241296 RepID=UPI003515FB76